MPVRAAIPAMSGLRQGELLALRWGDVDWGAKKIRVRQSYVRGHWLTPKSRRGSRSVPLAGRVAAALRRHFSSLGERFKKSLRAAGGREVRFNDLRHTFGTRMAAAGVPMRRLQEWMGHRDFRTTLIYARLRAGGQ